VLLAMGLEILISGGSFQNLESHFLLDSVARAI